LTYEPFYDNQRVGIGYELGLYRWQKIVFGVGSLLGLLGLSLFGVWLFLAADPKGQQSPPSPSPNQDIEEFFKVYWQRPISVQGVAPSYFTKKEASLTPAACGSCHAQQYADWENSLHSKAMGPGPWGQILNLTHTSPAEAVFCMTCHAPLGEQMPVNIEVGNGNQQTPVENPNFDSQLQLKGITCAACHVRQHQRFGPPKAEGDIAPRYPVGMPNHGGVQRTPYFEKAEFCRDCHQFDPENTLLVNGKPLQDTFREWKGSTWGEGEAACQSCHMPNRRHFWKGIHDREWVKEGVRIEAQVKEFTSAPGATLELELDVTNSAVGHKFPTYITPKVFVRAALLDNKEKALPGTEQEKIIGWDVRPEGGEWKEYFDTRISPGEKAQHTFLWDPPTQAKKVRAWVEVHPDHFYHVHFYPAYLTDRTLVPEARGLIEKALGDSGRTPYLLFEKVIPIH